MNFHLVLNYDKYILSQLTLVNIYGAKHYNKRVHKASNSPNLQEFTMHLETWKVLGVNGSELFTYTVSQCPARRTWEWPQMYVPCGAMGKAHPHVTHVSLRI